MTGGWASTLKSPSTPPSSAWIGIPTTSCWPRDPATSNSECFLPTLKKWMRSQPAYPGAERCLSVSWCSSSVAVAPVAVCMGSASRPVAAAWPGSATTVPCPLPMPQKVCRSQLWRRSSCPSWVCRSSQRTASWLLATIAAPCSLTTTTAAAWPLSPSWTSLKKHPAQHVGHGALPQHGQAGHDRGPQHGAGDATAEQHHPSVYLWGGQARLSQILHYCHRQSHDHLGFQDLRVFHPGSSDNVKLSEPPDPAWGRTGCAGAAPPFARGGEPTASKHWRCTWRKPPCVFRLNIIGKSVGFFKAAVIWVLFGGLFCFVLQFHSILDQSFSSSSLLWNVVNTNLKERVGEVCKLSAEKN